MIDDLASQLRAMTVRVLLDANTLAGNQVEENRDAPWTDADVCAINVQTPYIERHGLGERVPQFLANVHLLITARMLANTEAGATRHLDILRIQVENAVFRTQSWLTLPMERITECTTSIEFPGDNERNEGLMKMLIQVQCTDDFMPYVPNTPLKNLTMQVPNPTMSGGVVSGVLSGSLIAFDTSLPGATIHE